MVRIPDEDLAHIDAAVERGEHPSRSAAILAAIRRSARADRERWLAERYQRAYAALPEQRPVLGSQPLERALERHRTGGGEPDL